jgi:hypothetical protein
MERHSPKTTPYVLGGAETTVYTLAFGALPAEIPVTFFNTGTEVIKLRVQGDTNYIPFGPGAWLTFNPSGNVYATTDGAAANLLVTTGIRAGTSGVSSTGALSATELSTLTAVYSLKELAALNLRQAQLTNEYLARIIDEQLSERDLSPHVLGVHDI